VLEGDCITVMKTLADDSVDAIVTDPPYGSQSEEPWKEVLRVAKPGAHLVVFGGSRNFHCLVCAIEDAGWEIRDSVSYLFDGEEAVKEWFESLTPEQQKTYLDLHSGQTVKVSDIALKPALEPICLARKPLAKGHTVAANVMEYGTGAIHIDDCRVVADGADINARVSKTKSGKEYSGAVYQSIVRDGSGWDSQLGRWPANLILDESETVLGLFPQTASGSGTVKRASSKSRLGNQSAAYHAESRAEGHPEIFYGDAGSASRFFYSAAKREELLRYQVRLVTPSNGLVLDPFCGSGSTGKACMLEGFSFTGIDNDPASVEIAKVRVMAAMQAQAPEPPVGAPEPPVEKPTVSEAPTAVSRKRGLLQLKLSKPTV
jgi:predicted RNA methylase